MQLISTQTRNPDFTRTIRLRGVWLITLLIISPVLAHAQFTDNALDCGSLNNAFGPFDYTNAAQRSQHLEIVEGAHFTQDVKLLIRGTTAVSPYGDIAYTLRAWPNHHGALDAMARLHRRHNTEKFEGRKYSLTCWFERAKKMSPRDGNVYLLHGIHLLRVERYAQAEANMLRAVELMPGSAEANYNIGLLYVRIEDYEQASEYAQTAYSLGYPLPGRRKQLINAGYWNSENDKKPK